MTSKSRKIDPYTWTEQDFRLWAHLAPLESDRRLWTALADNHFDGKDYLTLVNESVITQCLDIREPVEIQAILNNLARLRASSGLYKLFYQSDQVIRSQSTAIHALELPGGSARTPDEAIWHLLGESGHGQCKNGNELSSNRTSFTDHVFQQDADYITQLPSSDSALNRESNFASHIDFRPLHKHVDRGSSRLRKGTRPLRIEDYVDCSRTNLEVEDFASDRPNPTIDHLERIYVQSALKRAFLRPSQRRKAVNSTLQTIWPIYHTPEHGGRLSLVIDTSHPAVLSWSLDQADELLTDSAEIELSTWFDEIDWDSCLQKYAGDDDNHILPPFGESDSEAVYDSDVMKEIEEESLERESTSALRVQFSYDKVCEHLKDILSAFSMCWKERRLPKLERRSSRLLRRHLKYAQQARTERVLQIHREIDDLAKRRVDLFLQAAQQAYFNLREVERQAESLRETVFQENDQEYFLNLYERHDDSAFDSSSSNDATTRELIVSKVSGPRPSRSEPKHVQEDSMSDLGSQYTLEEIDEPILHIDDEEDVEELNSLEFTSPSADQDQNGSVIQQIQPVPSASKHYESLHQKRLIILSSDSDSDSDQGREHVAAYPQGARIKQHDHKASRNVSSRRASESLDNSNTPIESMSETGSDVLDSVKVVFTEKEDLEVDPSAILDLHQKESALLDSSDARTELSRCRDAIDNNDTDSEHASQSDLKQSRSRGLHSTKKRRKKRRKRVFDSDSEVESDSSNDCARRQRKRRRRPPVSQHILQHRRQQQKERQLIMSKAQEQLGDQATQSGTVYINPGDVEVGEPIEISANLACHLKAHQIEGVRFMWRETVMMSSVNGCLLAHTMGLGKTLQVITYLDTLGRTIEDNKSWLPRSLRRPHALILCPASLVQNWVQEFYKWAPSCRLGPIFGIASDSTTYGRLEIFREWNANGGVMIMSYHLFQQTITNSGASYAIDEAEELSELLETVPRVVVADEAHHFKNDLSQIGKAVRRLKTKARIALTGSPLANNLMEYWSIMDWIDSGHLGSKSEFRAEHYTTIVNGNKHDATSYERRQGQKQLQFLLSVIGGKIDRRNLDCLQSLLPKKSEYVLFLKCTTIQKTLYNSFLEALSDDITTSTKQLLSLISRLRWICNHPALIKHEYSGRKATTCRSMADVLSIEPGPSTTAKSNDIEINENIEDDITENWRQTILQDAANVDESPDRSTKVKLLLSILEGAKRRSEKVLIFSFSIPTIQYLANVITLHELGPLQRITGASAAKNRVQDVKEFNDRQGYAVCIISTKAGGQGLNMTGANRVVLFDHEFNPIWAEQAVGRSYRMGQTRDVHVYRFLIKGSFEMRLFQQALTKLGLTSKVVDKKNVMTHMKTHQTLLAYFERMSDNDLLSHAMEDVEDSLLLEALETCSDDVLAIEKTESFHVEEANHLDETDMLEIKAKQEAFWQERERLRLLPALASAPASMPGPIPAPTPLQALKLGEL